MKLTTGAHRRVFRALSRLPRRAQGAALREIFDHKYRVPDPFGVNEDGESGCYQRYKYRATLECVRPHLVDPGGARLLDVGCGEGHFLARLGEAFPEARLHGVDVSASAVARARELLGDRPEVDLGVVDLISGRVPGHYDAIFCSEVLYYLGGERRGRQVVDRLWSLLARDGVLVLQHPWPEARLLHLAFDLHAGLLRIDELVDHHEHRPFAVTVYRRPTLVPSQRRRPRLNVPR